LQYGERLDNKYQLFIFCCISLCRSKISVYRGIPLWCPAGLRYVRPFDMLCGHILQKFALICICTYYLYALFLCII